MQFHLFTNRGYAGNRATRGSALRAAEARADSSGHAVRVWHDGQTVAVVHPEREAPGPDGLGTVLERERAIRLA